MTPAQIRTVRASFARIEANLPDFGRRFYDRLFAIAPELRATFTEDMAAQEAKFMKLVSELVNMHLHSLLSLPVTSGRAAIPAFARLGRNHADIGVRPEHFGVMFEALTQVLRAELGEHFTADVHAAWTEAFTVLAHAMAEGMGDVPAEEEHFLDRLPEEAAGSAASPASVEAPELQQFFR